VVEVVAVSVAAGAAVVVVEVVAVSVAAGAAVVVVEVVAVSVAAGAAVLVLEVVAESVAAGVAVLDPIGWSEAGALLVDDPELCAAVLVCDPALASEPALDVGAARPAPPLGWPDALVEEASALVSLDLVLVTAARAMVVRVTSDAVPQA
jgi:hypothetical protein